MPPDRSLCCASITSSSAPTRSRHYSPSTKRSGAKSCARWPTSDCTNCGLARPSWISSTRTAPSEPAAAQHPEPRGETWITSPSGSIPSTRQPSARTSRASTLSLANCPSRSSAPKDTVRRSTSKTPMAIRWNSKDRRTRIRPRRASSQHHACACRAPGRRVWSRWSSARATTRRHRPAERTRSRPYTAGALCSGADRRTSTRSPQ